MAENCIVSVNPKPSKGLSSKLLDLVERVVVKLMHDASLPLHYLSGNFAPVRDETPPVKDLPVVHGYLPVSERALYTLHPYPFRRKGFQSSFLNCSRNAWMVNFWGLVQIPSLILSLDTSGMFSSSTFFLIKRLSLYWWPLIIYTSLCSFQAWWRWVR